MAEDEDLNFEQQPFDHLDPISSILVIRESPIFAKDDHVDFPPINHENLQVASSIDGSPSRGSSSSSSFSLFPSDSDAQPILTACEFDRKYLSDTDGKSPPSDSEGQPPLITCEFEHKPPRSHSEQGGKSPWKPLYREANVLRFWWELLLARVYSKLKNFLTWFSTTLPLYYPFLSIAVWWWIRVRARRRRINLETTLHLRDAIKERDERIVQLLHQIAQMNELLVKHHKNIVSRK